MKCALLIIDLQEAYRRGEDGESMARALPQIQEALAAFRARKLPIVWIQHDDEDSPAGSPGFELIDGLAPLPGEPRIVKRYGNAFNKTSLAELLRGAGVDTALLAGYCAEHCVLSTYRGARDVDLTPVLLRGAIASGSRENLGFVERLCDLVSMRFLVKAL